jgi:coenzyme PQQ biosynthesis protein C
MGRIGDNGIVQAEAVLMDKATLRQRLQHVGEIMYHHLHPFHLRMHAGELTRGQMQAWVLNRYYYQSCIPIKDAIILSKSDDAAFRRAWRKRIIDHDGDTGVGGIEKWLQLAEAAGLERDYVIGGHAILPGVRYAVDAYVNLVREGTLLEAVSSSLTELFAGNLIALRMDALAKYYPWLQHGLAYFQGRLTQAPEDAAFAFEYAAECATTPQLQALVIRSLQRKCSLLWAQLDALQYCYVEPGSMPPQPSIFRPEAR